MEDQTITFEYETLGGKVRTVGLNPIIDIREFRGTAGFPLLVLAAATREGLSINAVWYCLLDQRRFPGCERVLRSTAWLQRRRWLFLPWSASNLRNRDGKDKRALQIIAEHPDESARSVSLLLKECGINRSREWVRRNRGATSDTHSP